MAQKQFTEYNIYKANGEQTLHVVRERRARIGKGWIAMFKKAGIELIRDLPPAQLRIFLLLSFKQTYELYVVISAKKLAEALGLSYKRTLEALQELAKKNIIKRVKFDGVQVFVINPLYTVCGAGTKQQRDEIWELMVRRDTLAEAICDVEDINAVARVKTAISSIESQIQEIVEGKQFEGSVLEDVDGKVLESGEDNSGSQEESRSVDEV